MVSWDERSGEALVQVSLPGLPSTTQLQMNDRLAILFDGKMITAVEAAAGTQTGENRPMGTDIEQAVFDVNNCVSVYVNRLPEKLLDRQM